jgi:4-amino-4-deoxy-L-arabinose transferase-like glycosyltransferase
VQGVVVLCLVSLFVVISWQSVQGLNTLWDEQQDVPAVTALLQHPLWGTSELGSEAQAWLPMYATALVFAYTGVSLSAARLLSIAIGALTILMTWVAGRRWFGSTAALLAATLLTCSPYFISFSRTAMTEGDAFCPLTVLLALLAFDAYRRWRNSSALFIFAAALGLAMSAKFFAVILVPALALCDLAHYRVASSWQGDRDRRSYRPLLGWIMATAALVCLAMSAAQGHQVPLAIVLWAAGVVSLLLTAARFLTQHAVRWPPLAAWLAILLLATTVCLVAFPAHVLQPGVLQQLLNRASQWDGRQPLTLLGEHLRLYSGILLLKLGVPLGVLSVAAVCWVCLRAWWHTGLRCMVAVLGIYIVMLVTLPLRQTFYLMSIYPLLILIVSGFLVEMTTALHSRSILHRAWIGTAIVAHLWLLWGVVQVYPEFGWYGYETIGARWLGEESRGYRNIIQITNDGTEDALRWSVAHVPSGARVVSYLSAYHVVEAFAAGHTLPFELIQRPGDIDGAGALRPDAADYFLIDINTLIVRDLPLQGEGPWGPPVHTIWRGRGRYRMPVVHIYSQPMSTDGGN